MLLPTIIVVNDDESCISHNVDLAKLVSTLSLKLRVYLRSSIQGEQLYGVREGILYFDESGHRQRVWRDDYSTVIDEVEKRLASITDTRVSLLIRKYQDTLTNKL